MDRKMRLALQFRSQPYFCDDGVLKFPILEHIEDVGRHFRFAGDQQHVTGQGIRAGHQQW